MNTVYFLNENVNSDLYPIRYILRGNINKYSDSLCEEFENKINAIMNNINESVTINENKITDFIKKIISAIINFIKKGVDYILRIVRGSDKKYSECMQKLRTMDQSEKINIKLYQIPLITKVPSNDIARFIRETGNEYVNNIKNNNKYDEKNTNEIFNDKISKDFIKLLTGKSSADIIKDKESFDKFIKDNNIISEYQKEFTIKDLYNYLKNNPNYGDRYFATPLKNIENILGNFEKINVDDDQKTSIANIISFIIKPLCQYFTTFLIQIQNAQKYNLDTIYNALIKDDKDSSNDLSSGKKQILLKKN